MVLADFCLTMKVRQIEEPPERGQKGADFPEMG
jgi:hypothetical protein